MRGYGIILNVMRGAWFAGNGRSDIRVNPTYTAKDSTWSPKILLDFPPHTSIGASNWFENTYTSNTASCKLGINRLIFQ